ncbi:NUDIX domain-containing protein [Pseudarthrobacter sp. J64]|uniref:NUDIX domain-containing protein n=1 Tax=Pseudarthrobacter sp. J64 TaxID=3116485 RepID=UPI002E8198FF|nr:NUDIX domain-containing protein [Pseudarthrobacter sp. J64]MEE2569912.1 NUDIX domain-containing protein [Pseudarthrobacter sp. J64]
MSVRSAGILLYRWHVSERDVAEQDDAGKDAGTAQLQVWIAHMGGPFWARKDARAWSIPKGEYLEGEDPLVAALREFEEEMGTPAPAAGYVPLGEFRQPSGKLITAFAAESGFQPEVIASNTFPLEWPKGSGNIQQFPEIDDAGWFSEEDARVKLVKGQLAILDALLEMLREEESRAAANEA